MMQPQLPALLLDPAKENMQTSRASLGDFSKADFGHLLAYQCHKQACSCILAFSGVVGYTNAIVIVLVGAKVLSRFVDKPVRALYIIFLEFWESVR